MSHGRLSELERTAVIDAVASAIRHDTRNKLGTVRNAAYYIRRKIEDTAVYKGDVRMAGFFELMEEALDGIDDLLTKMMGHRLPESPQLELIRLGACIAPALKVAQPPANITVTTQLEDTTEVAADSAELVLLLRSLIDNAAEAMPDGGELCIRAYEAAYSVCISVQDSGPGFTPDAAHHAFDAFYSTKLGHAGLGLCLVKRIAARHRGAVSIEAVPHGAKVTIRFPKSHEY